jgi:putative flippase GtrA
MGAEVSRAALTGSLGTVPTVAAASLRSTVRASWRILVKELSAFSVVGMTAFVIDLGLFQLLYVHVHLGAVTARTLSTLVSVSVAYVGHRYWSFSHRARRGVRREYAVFAAVNAVTLMLNVGAVAFVHDSLGQDSAFVLQLVNVVTIGVGTVIRYLSYRKWVFPARTSAPPMETSAAA